ncbi:MAG: glycosyltransferase [Anaerolineales bacterium]|nr:MAG: glycosyltransferase [Anaerolineales bacterium]
MASSDQPLVSIITPSYNQAAFLEDTILSVTGQDYPNLEYFVVDGGSNDGSVELIKRYANKLDWWVSEPDQGQADAINKGLARTKGEFVAWLNSDDFYRPGAVAQAVAALQQNPQAGIVYADLDSIDRTGRIFNTIHYRQFSLLDLLSFEIIGQPTVFMRRAVLQQAGPLDASYRYLLDHQLWLRMLQQAPAMYVPAVWAAARHHASAKNVGEAAGFGREAMRILAWAGSQPHMRELIAAHHRQVLAGAHVFDARYLLDGGQAAAALRSFGRVASLQPGRLLRHLPRIFFAFLSLFGLGGLRRVFQRREY